MTPKRLTLALAPIALCGACVAAGHAAETAQAGAPAIANVQQIMTGGVNDATMQIWDVGNNAMDDAGGIDPQLMSDARWDQLASAGASLAAELRKLAEADRLVAAAVLESPDEVVPGVVSMADVQRYIDADPVAFRELAEGMATHADGIAQAALDKDAARAGELVAEMDLVCETCHSQYWYPEN